jgi:hypothetical protein
MLNSGILVKILMLFAKLIRLSDMKVDLCGPLAVGASLNNTLCCLTLMPVSILLVPIAKRIEWLQYVTCSVEQDISCSFNSCTGARCTIGLDVFS